MPTRVGRADSWNYVSAGDFHACAVRTSRTLWCWGYNRFGQLGDGTTTDRRTPKRVGHAGDWRHLSAGMLHTAALRG